MYLYVNHSNTLSSPPFPPYRCTVPRPPILPAPFYRQKAYRWPNSSPTLDPTQGSCSPSGCEIGYLLHSCEARCGSGSPRTSRDTPVMYRLCTGT